MPELNQRGFAPIIFILVLVLLLIGIIGGAFYLKKTNPKISQAINQQIFKQSASSITSNSQEVSNLSNTKITEKSASVFENKVIFFDNTSYQLKIASPLGVGLTNFTDKKFGQYMSVVALSSDNKKILLTSFDVVDFNSPTIPEFSYYISDLTGSSFQVVDINKLKPQLSNLYITATGWTTDGKILLGAIENNKVSDYNKNYKNIIATYDYLNNKVDILFEKQSSVIGGVYYDNDKKLLVYSEAVGPGANNYFVRNLNNNTELPIKISNLFPSPNLGKYYLSGFITANHADMKRTEIFSIENPQTPIGAISLQEENARFGSNVYWSPSYNYFAIMVSYTSTNSTPVNKYPKLNIYTREGKLVSSIELKDGTTTNSILVREIYSPIIFSLNEKYILIASKPETKLYVEDWRSYDINTGTSFIEKTHFDGIGNPFVWY